MKRLLLALVLPLLVAPELATAAVRYDASQYNGGVDMATIKMPGSTQRQKLIDVLAGIGGVVNAKAYGAKGDGITDDTAALQAALTAGAGGEVFVPAGDYLVSSPITLPAGTTVRGVSSPGVADWNASPFAAATGGTRFLQTGAVSSIFLLTNGKNTLRELTVMHSGAITVTSGSLISIVGNGTGATGNGYVLDRVTVSGGYDNIHIGGAVQTSWVSILRSFSMSAKRACIYIDGSTALANDISISNTMVLMPQSGTVVGLKVQGYVEALSAVYLSTWGGAYGLYVDSVGTARPGMPFALKFTQSYFDSSTSHGIFMNNVSNVALDEVWSVGSTGGNGVLLTNFDNVRIIGGEYSQNSMSGFAAYGPGTHLTIRGASAFNNNVGGLGGNGFGIGGGGVVTDFAIQGCLTGRMAGGNLGQNQWGVSVSAAAHDRYIVADNLLGGNSLGLISDSGTGVNKRIANNY